MRTYKLFAIKGTRPIDKLYFALSSKQTRDQLAKSYKANGYRVSKKY